MELTIAFSGEVKFRLPIDAALEWMASALAHNGNDPSKAQAALRKALDAVQRRIA